MAFHTHNLSPFGDSVATLGLVSMRPFQVIKPLLEHAIMKRRTTCPHLGIAPPSRAWLVCGCFK